MMMYPSEDMVTVEYRGEILSVNNLLDEHPNCIEEYEQELDCYFIISMRTHHLGQSLGDVITYDCIMRMPRPGSKDFVFSAHSIRDLCEFVEGHFVTGPQYIEVEEPLERNINWAIDDSHALDYIPFHREERWRFGPNGERLKFWVARF
jgi:hypothetical protein